MAGKNIIDSLFVALGFEIDTKGLDEFAGIMGSVAKTTAAVGAAAYAAAGAVGLFVTQVAQGIDELGDFAEREDVAVEMIQEMGYAAQLAGSDIEAVKSSISGINRVIGEAALGVGRGAQTFQKLGMSAKHADGSIKSVDDLLAEVADRMQGLSRQESIALAEKLGIDRSLIPLLMRGSDAIAELREEAKAFGVVTQEQADAAGALTDELDRAKFMIGAIGKQIALGMMPAIKDAIKGFREWVMQNREIIRAGIERVLGVVSTLIERVWFWTKTLAGAARDAVDYLLKFNGALKTVAVTLGALFLAFAPAGALIGAAVLALALFIDDMMAFEEGGDSLVGDLIQKFPEVAEAIYAVWAALQVLWDLVVMAFKGWVLLLDALWPSIQDVASVISTILVGAFDLATKAVTGFIDMVTAAIDKVFGLATAVKDFFTNSPIGKAMTGTLSFAGDVAANATPIGFAAKQAVGILGKAGDVTNQTSTQTTTTQISAPITINSPDPAKAGESVRKELDRMNKQSTRNGDSAVAY